MPNESKVDYYIPKPDEKFFISDEEAREAQQLLPWNQTVAKVALIAENSVEIVYKIVTGVTDLLPTIIFKTIELGLKGIELLADHIVKDIEDSTETWEKTKVSAQTILNLVDDYRKAAKAYSSFRPDSELQWSDREKKNKAKAERDNIRAQLTKVYKIGYIDSEESPAGFQSNDSNYTDTQLKAIKSFLNEYPSPGIKASPIIKAINLSKNSMIKKAQDGLKTGGLKLQSQSMKFAVNDAKVTSNTSAKPASASGSPVSQSNSVTNPQDAYAAFSERLIVHLSAATTNFQTLTA